MIRHILCAAILVGCSLGQTVDVPGSRTVDGALSAKSTNNIYNPSFYSGADMCAKINAAILANQSSLATAVIDARSFTGTQACASNPFSAVVADVILLLGEGVTIQTTVPWVTSSSGNAQIIGSGRGSSGRGTTIQAVTGFPATCDALVSGCPILRLGDGTGPAFGQRFENATLDCNGITGCIGLYSTDIQEQSGAYHFSILNFPIMGILIDGSSNVGAGPFWAQHYTLFDGEVYALAFGTSSTIGVKLIGGNNAAGGETAPGLVARITASGKSGHVVGTAFQFEQFWGGELVGLNAENASNGYQFGISKPMNGTTASDLRCANVSGNCVWITSNSPFSNNIVLMGIQNTPTVASNTIEDDLVPQNIADATVGLYIVGNGYTSGGMTRLTTSSTSLPSALTGLNLNNRSNSSQILTLNGGASTDVAKVLQFQDRGTNKWSVQSTGTDQFLIFDHTLNRARLWFNPADGNTYWNSNSTGATNVNGEANNGTGGFKVWSGGTTPTNVFFVTGAGVTSWGGGASVSSSNQIPTYSGTTTNHAVCIKAPGPPVQLGTCSTTPDGTGMCTCN